MYYRARPDPLTVLAWPSLQACLPRCIKASLPIELPAHWMPKEFREDADKVRACPRERVMCRPEPRSMRTMSLRYAVGTLPFRLTRARSLPRAPRFLTRYTRCDRCNRCNRYTRYSHRCSICKSTSRPEFVSIRASLSSMQPPRRTCALQPV